MFPVCGGRMLANMSEFDPRPDMPLVNWSEVAVSGQLPTGTVTLLLADVEGSTRLWETTDTDPPTLNLATFNINGVLMFAGASSGNGQVSANGNSYKVVGDSGAGTHFEIDATCA
jgi:hypothetical protein